MNRQPLISRLVGDFSCMRRLMTNRSITVEHTFSMSQKELLRVVMLSSKALTVGELAKTLKISSSATTQQVEALESTGYLLRTQSANDRRLVQVSLTAKGQESLKQIMDQFTSHFADLVNILTDEELSQFANIVQKITNTKQPKEQN